MPKNYKALMMPYVLPKFDAVQLLESKNGGGTFFKNLFKLRGNWRIQIPCSNAAVKTDSTFNNSSISHYQWSDQVKQVYYNTDRLNHLSVTKLDHT